MDEEYCKEIGNKTALSEYAGKTLALTIKYLDGDRNGWGIGEVFFATDNADLYNTKTGKVDVEGTAATDNICAIEYPVDDVIAAYGRCRIYFYQSLESNRISKDFCKIILRISLYKLIHKAKMIVVVVFKLLKQPFIINNKF